MLEVKCRESRVVVTRGWRSGMELQFGESPGDGGSDGYPRKASRVVKMVTFLLCMFYHNEKAQEGGAVCGQDRGEGSSLWPA